MLAGQTGNAIFLARTENPKIKGDGDWPEIDHFAFNVDQENFARARQRFELLGLKYKFQDYHYFHSLYINDPDGHIEE